MGLNVYTQMFLYLLKITSYVKKNRVFYDYSVFLLKGHPDGPFD